MASICSLPMNLCLRQAEFATGGYKVWSLEDIPVGIKFGPYQQKFIDVNKNNKDRNFEKQVLREYEGVVLDDRNKDELNWLFYINYAHQEEKSNMIIFHTDSGLYYITCRPISANTELLVYDWDNIAGGNKGYRNGKVTKEDRIKPQVDKLFGEENGKLYCDIKAYRKTLMGKLKLIAHEMILPHQKPFECNDCGKRSYLTVHEVIHHKSSECKICMKKFKCLCCMKIHEQNHTVKNPFQCNLCGKKYMHRNSLSVHKIAHTDQRPFKCNFCEKRFSRRPYLNAHKMTHTSEKPFSCDVCGKKLSNKCNWIGHVRNHTGDRPFECIICMKKFTTKSLLNRHEKIHHIGDKRFECNICGYRFNTRYYLKVHESIHTDNDTSSVNKYSSKNFTNLHENSITTEKPFKCTACGTTFYNESDMAVHERIHKWRETFEV